MQLIAIPSGVLIMGDNRFRDATPQHRIEVGSFHIGKYPVTNVEFAPFVADEGYARREYWTEMGWRALQARPYSEPSFWHDPRFNAPALPVVGVTWYEALAFCRWLSAKENQPYALPSEAEWEFAARGAESARNFPWGDRFEPSRANTVEAQFGRTTPVDQFPLGVSPFGVWDLSGNVFEWTRSRWGPNWQELQFPYPYCADDAREGEEGSSARSMRGGSWFSPYSEALCAFRSRYLPGSRGSNIGFRVAAFR